MRRVLAVVLWLSFCGVLAFGGLGGYVRWARDARRDVPLSLRQSQLVRRLLTESAYSRLMKAVSSDVFATVYDFNDAVALSRRLFVPTEMFGVMKYRYRPGVDVCQAVVWSGLDVQRVAFEETPYTRSLLRRLHVYESVSFRTDERGFKPTGLPQPPGAPAVLFLGDSFTEGAWTAPRDTFVSRYGAFLRDAPRPEVAVNMGLDGYGPLEEHWTLEHSGAELNPRLVIVNLFPNDVGWDFIAPAHGHPTPERNYTEMFDHLEGMRSFTARQGAAFVVAVIPFKEQLGALRHYGVFQDQVRAWCERAGVRYVDPRADLQAFGADRAYLWWDPHLSPAGHARYAQFLYDATADLLTAAVASP